MKGSCNSTQKWKLCHLCEDDGVGPTPRYDLWHVLFECPSTCQTEGITSIVVRDACKAFASSLCNAVEQAVTSNAESMSNTQNAGVSHSNILLAANEVRRLLPEYDWDCTPGKWLIYTLLLALPYPAVAVRPDPVQPVWLCAPKRKRRGVLPERNLHGMPIAVPELPDAEYTLPVAMGRLFDSTILSNSALRPLADAWCKMATVNLLRAGAVVRPLRAAADALAAQRVGLSVSTGEDAETSSAVSSSCATGSDSVLDSDSEP